jgi:hypothetical protein
VLPRARRTSASPPINSVVSGEDDPAAALETLATRLLAFFFAEAAACFLFCARVGGRVPPRPRRAVDGAGGGGDGGDTGLW